MQYLLDTSICVFFLRGELDLNKKIIQIGRENCFISEMSINFIHLNILTEDE